MRTTMRLVMMLTMEWLAAKMMAMMFLISMRM